MVDITSKQYLYLQALYLKKSKVFSITLRSNKVTSILQPITTVSDRASIKPENDSIDPLPNLLTVSRETKKKFHFLLHILVCNTVMGRSVRYCLFSRGTQINSHRDYQYISRSYGVRKAGRQRGQRGKQTTNQSVLYRRLTFVGHVLHAEFNLLILNAKRFWGASRRGGIGKHNCIQ